MSGLKRFALQTLARAPFRSIFDRFRVGVAPIFMLHRFADPATGIRGHDPAQLRRFLAWLRGANYELVGLEELIVRLGADPTSVSRAVSLTVDDGYEDFSRVGWPVFAEFDCPVTVFVTSDFLDGKMWFWWDRVALAFERTARRRYSVELSDRTIVAEWTDDASRAAALHDVVESLKIVGESDRTAALSSLSRALDVELPESPTRRFAPLTWDEARRLEALGVRFGPHSVTHPILSRTSDAQSAAEIDGSWQRVRQELSRPAAVFCYPNGRMEDFGAREIDAVRRAGLEAAVTTHPAYAAVTNARGSTADGPYTVPRFPWPDEPEQLVQIASGMERAKRLLLRRR